MAYQKQKRRITAGGLNLLPPADLVQEPDSVVLQNWRQDQAGALVSRRGMVRFASGLGGAVHSLYRIGDDRYGGVGSTLLYGRDLATTAATGFDGQALFFAAHNDWVWIMNRGKRGKAQGASFYNMVPDPPTGKIVAAAGVQTSLQIATVEPSEAWQLSLWSGGEVRINPDVFNESTSAGSVSVTMGSQTATGLGTNWTPDLAGQRLRVDLTDGTTYGALIGTVESETSLTLANAFPVEGGSGLVYQIGVDVDASSFDTGNKVEGMASFSMRCYTAGRWQAEFYLPTPKDTKLFGVANDRDQFKVWIYAENPPAVKRIRITLFNGDTAGDPSMFAQIDDPSVLLNQTPYTWTQLSILRGLDPVGMVAANPEYQTIQAQMAAADFAGDTALYAQLQQQSSLLYASLLAKAPYFRTFGAAFDWGAVTRAWLEFEITEASFVHIDEISMVGSMGGALKGDFVFFVTFDNGSGHESTGGAESDAVTFDNQPAALTAIPVSPDPQVTRRHIYVSGGPFPIPLRADTIHDNTATTHTVSVDVDAVQAADVEMPFENDPPPFARGICGPYDGRLIAWSSLAHVARYWYTPVGKPFAWPGADDDGDGQWEDVGDAKEEILCVIPLPRTLVFLKEGSVHRLTGDPDTNSPEQRVTKTNVFGPRSACNAGDYGYYAGNKGMFKFTSDTAQLVSGKVQPIFEGQYVELSDGSFAVPVNLYSAPRSAFVMEYRAGRVYFSYPEEGSTTPNKTLVYEEAGDRWSTFKSALGGLSAIHFEGVGTESGLYGGTVGGGLYSMEAQGYANDAGSAIELLWQSALSDMGLPDNDKVAADVVIIHRTADAGEAPSTLTAKLIWDNGQVTVLGTMSSTTRVTRIFRLGTDGLGLTLLNAAVRIEGSATSTVRIFQTFLHWYALERSGLTFDTGVIDFGSLKVKECDELRMDITSTGATVNWALYSDLPGNAIASRETGVFTVAPGVRTVLPINLASIRRGIKWRFCAWSDGEIQMHDLNFHVLELGEYIDGAKGETWESKAALL